MGSAVSKPASLRFGVFQFDPESGELWKAGAQVKLQSQPGRVLSLLLERPGRTVGRSELREAVWNEKKYIDFERALNYSIRCIREALDDDARRPFYIETVSRRGYRFIAPVQRMDADGEAAGSDGAIAAERRCLPIDAAAEEPRTLLAVLPFENMSEEPGWSYFCEGLTEELVTELVRLEAPRLDVMARTSSRAFRDIGIGMRKVPEPAPSFFLEGSVRREADRIRITANLVRGRDHALIATEAYECALQGTFATQRAGAQQIVRRLVRPQVSSWSQ